MTIDYYAEARELATRIQREGLAAEAQALIDAMDAGSTATEILMALRWHLTEIDQANNISNLDTRRRIRDLLQGVHAALGE
jgi:hypothetical protein